MGRDALHTQLRVDNSTKCLYDSQSLCDFWSCASVEFIVMAPALDAYEIFNPEIIRYFKYIYIYISTVFVVDSTLAPWISCWSNMPGLP